MCFPVLGACASRQYGKTKRTPKACPFMRLYKGRFPPIYATYFCKELIVCFLLLRRLRPGHCVPHCTTGLLVSASLHEHYGPPARTAKSCSNNRSEVFVFRTVFNRMSKVISQLIWFCVATFSDWLKNLVPLYQPIRS